MAMLVSSRKSRMVIRKNSECPRLFSWCRRLAVRRLQRIIRLRHDRAYIPNAELYLVLKQSDVWHDAGCVLKSFVDGTRYDSPTDLSISGEVSLDPTHIPCQLPKRSVRASVELEFKNKEVSPIVYCKNVDWANAGWVLSSAPA